MGLAALLTLIRSQTPIPSFHLWSRHSAFSDPEILKSVVIGWRQLNSCPNTNMPPSPPSSHSELPVNLRHEAHLATHGGVLYKVPLFQNCDELFLAQLTEKMKTRLYAPNDLVIKVGESGDEMFFLNRGEVDIILPNGAHVATLGELVLFAMPEIWAHRNLWKPVGHVPVLTGAPTPLRPAAPQQAKAACLERWPSLSQIPGARQPCAPAHGAPIRIATSPFSALPQFSRFLPVLQ